MMIFLRRLKHIKYLLNKVFYHEFYREEIFPKRIQYFALLWKCRQDDTFTIDAISFYKSVQQLDDSSFMWQSLKSLMKFIVSRSESTLESDMLFMNAGQPIGQPSKVMSIIYLFSKVVLFIHFFIVFDKQSDNSVHLSFSDGQSMMHFFSKLIFFLKVDIFV